MKKVRISARDAKTALAEAIERVTRLGKAKNEIAEQLLQHLKEAGWKLTKTNKGA